LTRFAAAILVGFVAMTLASWVARKRYDWLLFALAGMILTNALSHFAGTVVTHSYSPGTLSGLVLWLPLGGAVLYRGLARHCAAVWCIGLAVGTAMNAGILLFTLNLGKIS
jgi:hypothetical protein